MAIVWPAGYYSIYYSPDEPEWDEVDVHAGGDAAGQLVIDIAGPPDGSGWGGVPQRRLRGGKQISKQRSSSQKMDQCWHLKLHINPSKSEFRTKVFMLIPQLHCISIQKDASSMRLM